jgi:small-conductance mechanosensitive channel
VANAEPATLAITPATFLGETAVGFAIGLAAAFVIAGAEFAGELMTTSVGLAGAAIFDPVNNQQGAILGSFMQVLALVILVATVFAAKWASRATRRGLSRVRGFRHDPTVLSFAVQVVRVIVYIVGFIAVLQRLGVQTTSILAVLGAASLAVGLALQGTLSNVAAGVMLLVLRPYRVGDLVDINNNVGTVTRLDLFFTQMSDANNVKIVIPNAKVFSDTMLNLSGQQTRRMELKLSVGYGSDLTEAASEALNYLDRCLDAGFRPGMGAVVPDRLFWSQPEDDESEEDAEATRPNLFETPFNETRH